MRKTVTLKYFSLSIILNVWQTIVGYFITSSLHISLVLTVPKLLMDDIGIDSILSPF